MDEDQARDAVADLSEDEVLARLHFRIAAEAHRRGDAGTTRRHVLRAGDLAPDDLTIWRAGMPLIGQAHAWHMRRHRPNSGITRWPRRTRSRLQVRIIGRRSFILG